MNYPDVPDFLKDITVHPAGSVVLVLCQRCGSAIAQHGPYNDGTGIHDAAFGHRSQECPHPDQPAQGYLYTVAETATVEVRRIR